MRPYRAIPTNKPIDSGEFVYGSLVWIKNKWVTDGIQCFIVLADTEPNKIFHAASGHYGTEHLIRVHPETVGQYTGVKDKNGKETYFRQRLKNTVGREYEIVWIDMMAAFWVIQTEYPYEKYTAELIGKLEIIHDKEINND